MARSREKFLRRVFLLTCAALAITQILPSLADELTPNPVPEVSEPSTQIPILIIEAEEESSTAPAPTTIEAEPADLPQEGKERDMTSSSQEIIKFEPLAPAPKARFVDQQSILFRAPGRFLVDPRATSATLAPVQIVSNELLMVCLSAPGRSIEVGAVRTLENEISVKGNGTSLLSLVGSGASISTLFNSTPGVRVVSPKKISPSQLSIGLGVLSDLPEDQGLCSKMPINQFLNISPLGLTMELVKNRIPVK